MAIRRSRLLISTQRSDIAARRTAAGRASELFKVWYANRLRMMEIDAWARCELDEEMLPVLPNNATDEFHRIRRNAPTPFGQLIVQASSENLVVDDIRMDDTDSSAPAWRLWQRNGLDARQVPLHESALTYGQAYNLILPARGRLDGERTAVIRGKSALRAVAFYRDDFDEYPDFFLEGEPLTTEDGTNRWHLWLTDDSARYELLCDWDGSNMETVGTPFVHRMGLCPVVRFFNRIDLEGRVVGEVAPFITLFGRIDQDAQDRLIVQRFGAWAVRTIAGMKEPATDEEKAAARIALGIGDLLVAESPDTKFGSLPATQMQPYIASRDSDIRDLAAVSQTPSYHLLGLSDNVGAEGLAAAEMAHMRKLDLRKLGLSESHKDSMRLGGMAMGDETIANDFTAQIHWKNTRTESFQSLAQALGTLATTLEIPPEMLWRRLPDWTQVDTETAKDLLRQMQAEALQQAEMETARQVEVAQAGGRTSSTGNGAA